MREIKFRAWDEIAKIMQYFNLFDVVLSAQIKIIMQYTGLKDKNNKKIYEGDIVKIFRESRNFIAKIEWGGDWKDCGFGLSAKRTKKISKDDPPYIWELLNTTYEKNSEIIGNIYENPELMERT